MSVPWLKNEGKYTHLFRVNQRFKMYRYLYQFTDHVGWEFWDLLGDTLVWPLPSARIR